MTTTTTTTTIRAALEAEKPATVAQYKQYIREYFAAFVAEFGDDTFALSKWSYDHTSRGEYFLRRRRVIYGFMSTRKTTEDYYGPSVQVLDEVAVAKAAAEYASQTIDQMIAKLESKTGGLSEVEVVSISPGALEVTLRGKRGADLVTIEQRKILNMSSHGTLFNQFPALIYVNGKKTSEAAYKRAA